MIPVLLFPQFDPVIVQVGPLAIRWYALAYITSLVIGWRLVRRFARLAPAVATPLQVDDFLTWATLGVVLGGRLGYVLFYQPGVYLAHPSTILAVWEGGMSFHGGMLGVAVAIIVFCRRNGIRLLGFADRIAIVAPIGLGLGRVANFINGELWGRAAPGWLPWAMEFPRAPDCPAFPTICVPRHPSQLYEALMEGVVLFAVMFVLSRRERLRERFGLLTGVFLVGYAVARIIGEYFREPDAFLGFLAFGTTMGQILSVPMLLAGLWLIVRARPQAGVGQGGMGQGGVGQGGMGQGGVGQGGVGQGGVGQGGASQGNATEAGGAR
jgi:phosphatidylglycerol:prolipoprotein diacylglycerol transferase